MDFSSGIDDWGNYSGSERKRKLIIDNTVYMLKYPDPIREIKNNLSYINNQFSEYVGCHVYESIGIPVQKTYLGQSIYNEREFIGVACRDFRNDGLELYPIKFIHSKDPWSTGNKTRRITFKKVYEIIRDLKDPLLEKEAVDHFWKMFVVDYLIGNYDRHLENWGFTIDQQNNKAPAPVYDCGSSLLALISDEDLEKEITTRHFLGASKEIYTPFSHEDSGHRVSFQEVLENPNADLCKAIKDVFPKISLSKIYTVIQDTPFMSDIRKKAMIESIKVRYNQVLLKVYVQMMFKDLSTHDQQKIIGRIKSENNVEMRKLGYIPLPQPKDKSQER